MGRKLLLALFLYSLGCIDTLLAYANTSIVSDESCFISYEVSQNEQDEYVVSLISDTTLTFPRNIVSTAQITLRVPTGGFEIGAINNGIDGVIFQASSRDNAPDESPRFDYISFTLATIGTSSIPFETGRKVDLFSFSNIGTCPNGMITLMDNETDPFTPPNSRQSNVGQQLTVSAFTIPDLPICVSGLVNCPGNTPPPSSDITVQTGVQPISCAGENDGIIILKPENGTPPYTYSWSNGATTASIEDLAPGDYTVTIQDATGFMFVRTFTIEDVALLELFISKVNASSINANDGSGRAIVTGGTMPYSYSWSSGATTSEINNLPLGTYTLTITDAHECTAIESIEIIDQSTCPVIDLTFNVAMPTCAGDTDGQISVTPQGGIAPYSYVWEHGNGSNLADNISAGSYMVTLTDGSGCTMSASTFLPDASPIVIDLDVQSNEIAASITGGMLPYQYAWSNGATTPTISNLSDGAYMLTVTDNVGCSQVASGVIATTGCNLGILDLFGPSITLDTIPCEEKGALCLPIPFDSIVNFSVFLDGADYSSNLQGCNFETFFAYSYAFFPPGNQTGAYTLREWIVDGVTFSGTFNNIDALVDSMNTWDTNGNWTNLRDISIIQGRQSGRNYGSMVLVAGTSATVMDVNTNNTPLGTEVSLKSGNHELVLVRNATTCSDTLTIELPCNSNNTNNNRDTTITLTINESELAELCLPNIFGNNLQVSDNTCPNLSGVSANITLDNTSNCILVEGLSIGTDEACYTIMDASTTINLTVLVIVEAESVPCVASIPDTIIFFAPACNPIQVCIDIPFSALSDATILSNMAPYTGGISPCEDDGSLLSFNNPGVFDLDISYGDSCSAEIVAIVACDTDEVLEQTIDLGESDVTCINIPGILNIFESVENICPEQSNTEVVFETLSNSGCISYTGIEIGTDTACIRACDIFGFCDTITLIFNVIDPTGTPPPIFRAVDDSATIRLNSSVNLDVLANDIFRTIDDFMFVEQPLFGEAFINEENRITYIAETGYCNEEIPDTFKYAICVDTICDTARVAVRVNCFVNENLIIYTGVSPNGDGVNDSFTVEGIENYPNNSVSIFNRWGNMVFQQNGYKNEWQSTWEDEQLLPDGTYFYILNLGDGSEPLKGYVYVRR